MEGEKYGLVKDMDKFIETGGKEGVLEDKEAAKAVSPAPAEPAPAEPAPAEPAPAEPAPAEPAPAPAPAEPAPATPTPEFKIEEHQAYIDLLAKNAELEAREIPKEINPKLKEIEAWAERTNRPIEDWVKFQADPSGLSDLEVVRENQRLKNPSLSEAELDFYMNDNFISDEETETEDVVMRKNIAFKKEVASGRDLLEKNRLVFDTAVDTNLSKEQKEDIAFAAQVRADRVKIQENREADNKAFKSVIEKTDAISLNLAEGKDLNFAVPVESKKDQDVYLSEMKRWENEDGSTNQQVMLEDSYKIRHFDEIVKLAYSQGKNDQLESSAERNQNIVPPARQHKTVTEGQYGFVGDNRGARRKQV